MSVWMMSAGIWIYVVDPTLTVTWGLASTVSLLELMRYLKGYHT